MFLEDTPVHALHTINTSYAGSCKRPSSCSATPRITQKAINDINISCICIPVEQPRNGGMCRLCEDATDLSEGHFTRSKERTRFSKTKGFLRILDGFFFKTKGFLPKCTRFFRSEMPLGFIFSEAIAGLLVSP